MGLQLFYTTLINYHKVKKYFFLGIILVLTTNLFGQEAESTKIISETNKVAIARLTDQVRNFPQEKIYLQLDKPYYSAGERIWYRAHMVHAAIHTPLAISRYIYVELINAHNDVVIRKKIRPVEDAIYFGQIDLSPEIAQGWYSIRAYTNFMRNIDEAYFYRQKIYIGNTLKGLEGITVNENTGSYNSDFIKATKSQADFDIQFFPEGGHLIAGNQQIVGFKAISKNGFGTDISGRIMDDQNKEITTFKSSHLGMGAVAISPEAGKSYTAICEDNHGQSITCKLPEVSEKNYTLSIKHNASIIEIKILTPNGTPTTDTLYVIGNRRGLPFLQSLMLPGNQALSISISKEGINSGVAQFLLLNSKKEILSERLIYIFGNDKANLSLKLDKANYIKRDAVHAFLLLKDSRGNPVEGNFSISVTDDNDIKIDPNEATIESYLLLQSDLKGYIENPNEYFRTDNKKAAYDLDLLMLTQGWKRYNVAATLAGSPDKATKQRLEIGPIISGKVQNFPARRGLPKVNVSFISNDNMHFYATTTDNYGHFIYQCPEFPDSTIFLVQSDKKTGSFVELVVNPDTFPKVKYSCLFPNDLKQDLAMKAYLKKSRDRYYYQNGMMSVKLKDVVVTAEKTDKNAELRKKRGSMYSNPSYSFSEEDMATATSIIYLLAKAPGITINGNNDGILLRNATPLIMVDNMRYQMEDLQNINIADVKLVDILRDPSETMLYGQEGNNGVICIYLKRGENKKKEPVELGRNQAKIAPLGYSMPAEFYVPKYQVQTNREDPLPDLRSTIFWKPNVKSNSNGEADIFFYTADSAGPFTITAEGVTPQGEIIRYQGKINKKIK
jgi:hypothetical protein